jgi:hypothetical protein
MTVFAKDISPREDIMKRIAVVLAALASFALAAPTTASANDMYRDGTYRGARHQRTYRDMIPPRNYYRPVPDVMAPDRNRHPAVGDVMAPTPGTRNSVGDVMQPSR